MDFRSANKFNVVFNALSGNFFPLTSEKKDLRLASGVFATLVWLVEFVYLSSTTIGMLYYLPPMIAIQVGGVQTIVSIEMIVLTVYLHSRSDVLRKLIGKINTVLVNSDDLRRCVSNTVEPRMKFLMIYAVYTVGSTAVWSGMPIVKILHTDRFTCYDYTVPSYVPVSSIDTKAFVCSIIVEVIGSSYILLKKTGIDVYTTYLITLLTAEYRYVSREVADALRDNNDENRKTPTIAALRKIVRHQAIVIEIGQMVTQLLSVNVGLIYINCILRFCLLGFSLITIPGEYFQKCMYIVYSICALMQVYSFCSCIQELLEASTAITKDGFHENWYGRGSTVKSMFHTIGLSNSMECRVNAFRIVDLTVPSFGAVLNQAYGACLILIKIY